MVIGPFCRDAFVRYFHEESKKYADLLVAKKIFLQIMIIKVRSRNMKPQVGYVFQNPKTLHQVVSCMDHMDFVLTGLIT